MNFGITLGKVYPEDFDGREIGECISLLKHLLDKNKKDIRRLAGTRVSTSTMKITNKNSTNVETIIHVNDQSTKVLVSDILKLASGKEFVKILDSNKFDYKLYQL